METMTDDIFYLFIFCLSLSFIPNNNNWKTLKSVTPAVICADICLPLVAIICNDTCYFNSEDLLPSSGHIEVLMFKHGNYCQVLCHCNSCVYYKALFKNKLLYFINAVFFSTSPSVDSSILFITTWEKINDALGLSFPSLLTWWRSSLTSWGQCCYVRI